MEAPSNNEVSSKKFSDGTNDAIALALSILLLVTLAGFYLGDMPS